MALHTRIENYENLLVCLFPCIHLIVQQPKNLLVMGDSGRHSNATLAAENGTHRTLRHSLSPLATCILQEAGEQPTIVNQNMTESSSEGQLLPIAPTL